MKSKLVLIGAAWKNDSRLMEAVDYLGRTDDDFMKSLGRICTECIPDFKNWGPSEAYHQDPDYAVAMVGGGLGITICISQLYQKEGRRIKELTKRFFDLLIETLTMLDLTNIHVFAETHVSSEDGESFFIEEGPRYT